ncbi:MAG: hypothetical protein WC628_05170 [Candidatus Omnitrophota bacterium]
MFPALAGSRCGGKMRILDYQVSVSRISAYQAIRKKEQSDIPVS